MTFQPILEEKGSSSGLGTGVAVASIYPTLSLLKFGLRLVIEKDKKKK